MKGFIAIVLAAVTVVTLFVHFGKTFLTRKPDVTSIPETSGLTNTFPSEPLAGGWRVNTDLQRVEAPENAIKAFDKAFSGTLGSKPVPVAYLGCQVVAGMNYRFICLISPENKSAGAELRQITIYCDLKENAEVTGNVLLNIADFTKDGDIHYQSNDLTGGWGYGNPCGNALSSEQQTAFDKAVSNVKKVKYTPVLCMGTQVVSGTNYAILCSAKSNDKDLSKALAVVTVYADLRGNAEIISVCGY